MYSKLVIPTFLKSQEYLKLKTKLSVGVGARAGVVLSDNDLAVVSRIRRGRFCKFKGIETAHKRALYVRTLTLQKGIIWSFGCIG
jgi:hypothetical protein